MKKLLKIGIIMFLLILAGTLVSSGKYVWPDYWEDIFFDKNTTFRMGEGNTLKVVGGLQMINGSINTSLLRTTEIRSNSMLMIESDVGLMGAIIANSTMEIQSGVNLTDRSALFVLKGNTDNGNFLLVLNESTNDEGGEFATFIDGDGHEIFGFDKATAGYGVLDIRSKDGVSLIRLAANADSYFFRNLGVGITTPTSKLHVIGDVNISGNLFIENNITINGTKVCLADGTDCILTINLAAWNMNNATSFINLFIPNFYNKENVTQDFSDLDNNKTDDWNFANNDSLVLNNDTIVRLNTTMQTGNINISGLIQSTFINANHYLTNPNMHEVNFYDDGIDIFLNVSNTGGDFSIEQDNTKITIFNEPVVGNDFKVFQIFSKEASFETEFTIYKAGIDRSDLFSRSLRIGGPTDSNCSVLDVSRMVDCATDVTGADLLVQDDIWNGGSMFLGNGSFNITDDGDFFSGLFPNIDKNEVDDWNSDNFTEAIANIEVNVNMTKNLTINGVLILPTVIQLSSSQSTVIVRDDISGVVGTKFGVRNTVSSTDADSGVSYILDIGSGNNMSLDLHSALDPNNPLTVVSHYNNNIAGHVWRINPNINSFFAWEAGKHNPIMVINKTGEINFNDSLFILPNGNVGVGETNPLEKLHVTGNLNVTGNVYVGGCIQYDCGTGTCTTLGSCI